MKIVLPLAGKGTRLLPHTQFTPKPLMFVAGKSILEHLMDQLITLNPSEFVFITGYLKEQIEQELKQKYPNIPMRFIEQKDPQGLGHAIYQSRDAFAKDEDMLVILGDQTFNINWDKMLQPSYNRISIVEVNDPSSFGIVNVDERGFVTKMEEKPENPTSNLAISGTYYFPSAQTVFSTLAHQMAKDIRTRGEIQITDTMKIMMEMGEQFEVLLISDWNDCGNHADLIQANQTLLAHHSQSYTCDNNNIINEPVWIDPSAKITNSTIGPNVSINAHTTINNSSIRNSVIDKNTNLDHCDFQDSYIGQNLSLENQRGSTQYLS